MKTEQIEASHSATACDHDFEHIEMQEVQPGILLLKLNRPKVLNALNAQLLKELDQAITALEQDASVRVLLITGEGDKAFAAGADISQMQALSPRAAKAFSHAGMSVFGRLESLPIPVIALVNGYALGGGCELALSCDFILAAEQARFGQPEVTLGVTAGFGGTQRLPRIVGRAMAMELLVSGRLIGAEEALRIGLVNHVYAQQQLLKEGLKLAGQICANSGAAVELTKELVQRGQDLDLDNACAMESGLFGLCFGNFDQREGMTAFVENRKPSFSSR